MNQVELAQELSKRTGLARSICAAIVGEIFSVVEQAAGSGNPVVIPGFGTFRSGKAGGPLTFEPELKIASVSSAAREAVQAFTQVTETKAVNLDSKRMTALKMVEEANRENLSLEDAEEAVEAEDASKKSSRRSRGGISSVDSNTQEIKKRPSSRGSRSSTEVVDQKPMKQHAASDRLSSLASDFLGLEKDDLERGLGLAEGVNPVAQGRRLVFPVQVSRQAKDAIEKLYRPTNGEERRSYKDLALKNFFVSLGSVVRDKQTHEPMLVFDVEDVPTPEGEKYVIKLLRVQERQAKRKNNESAAKRPDNPQELQFEEADFDCDRHDVLMVIDPAVGPRIHGFDIGTFRDNDRRERAEICLAQEFENWRAEQVD